MPMYHFVDGEGREVVMNAPPGGKDKSVAAMRQILKACGATRVAYLDEAWFMEADTDNNLDLEKINREGVEKQPGRIEVIIISAEDQAEGMIMATREIIRHGDRAVLGKLKMHSKMDSAEGRMIGLLPAPRVKH